VGEADIPETRTEDGGGGEGAPNDFLGAPS